MTLTTVGHHPLPVPALPGHVCGWTLRPAGSAPATGATVPFGTDPAGAVRTCTANSGHDGGPVVRVTIHRVLHHPLRGCYPVGAHDLLLELDITEPRNPATGDGRDTAGLLRSLVAALFAADPSCRRITAAPPVEDTAARERYAAGGFRPVAEADVREGTVVLMVVEPTQVTTIDTALSAMPH
ncbi:GNAT family N-acetyltransferase [Streptomyces sp. CB01580]|uniref:GNAT family N-acetyltransferase n=1 Tax=Streptomyces sp. CB01580 TaxID=1703933 RepID=UPI00093A22AD|nr:GNAT family N-acetyltransferase [Streptomyces sp. CB01580]